MACKHFQFESHSINKQAKFIIIDQLANTSKSKEKSPSNLLKEKILGI